MEVSQYSDFLITVRSEIGSGKMDNVLFSVRSRDSFIIPFWDLGTPHKKKSGVR